MLAVSSDLHEGYSQCSYSVNVIEYGISHSVVYFGSSFKGYRAGTNAIFFYYGR